jgi:glycosyltransferase involved in cell wall biosynthesis
MTGEKNYQTSCFTSVFKGAKWIEAFFEDILKQSIFDDVEFVIINANSPEKEQEEEVILDYEKKYKNIKYMTLEKDPGVYAVWNIGVEMSQGDFLSNWNLDDKRHPEHIEEHVKCLKSNPEIDLAYAHVLMTCTEKDTFEFNNAVAEYRMPEFSYENLLKFNMPHNCPVWRRRLHDNYGHFKTDMISAADFDLWLRAASQGSLFKGIDRTLGLYYKNPEGVSTKKETLSEAVQEVNDLRVKYSEMADYRNFIIK